MLHVIDGEKKRGKERRKKEEKKKKKRRKNQLFCYILRPIFVGGACGGLYGRGALAPPHNPSDPTKLALRLISTHYSMLGYRGGLLFFPCSRLTAHHITTRVQQTNNTQFYQNESAQPPSLLPSSSSISSSNEVFCFRKLLPS
jgi:hypothetical protein